MNARRIIFIDDDPNMRRMVALYLGEEDFQLETEGSPRKGLLKIKEQSYDLVISDIQMPDMDGFTMIRRIREFNSSVPILVISAFGEKDVMSKARAAGATEIIEKPFDREKLIGLINKFTATGGK